MRRLAGVFLLTAVVALAASCHGDALTIPAVPCTIETAHTVDTLGWVLRSPTDTVGPITAAYCGPVHPAR